MDKLPEALAPLASFAQFLVYKSRPSVDRPGKTDKFALHPLTGIKTDPGDPQAWMTFDKAAALVGVLGGHGVGFAFTEQDPFLFIDLDNCLHDGRWSEQAINVMRWFPGAAVEVSQSGTGAHIFASYSGTVPPHRTRRKDLPGLECYHTDRFAALTGNVCEGGSAAVDCTERLAQFVAAYLPPIETVNDTDWTSTARHDWVGPDDDDELIRRMVSSKPLAASLGADVVTFADLWNADAAKLATKYRADGSDAFGRSEADAALMQHLAFWTGCNCDRMERLALRSALVRGKWDREDYLQGTILKAARQQREVYREAIPSAAEVEPLPTPERIEQAIQQQETRDISVAALVDGDPFVPPDRQMEMFKGCAYVLDRHLIFTPYGMLDQGRFNAQYGGWSFAMDAMHRKTSMSPWECFTQSRIVRFPRVATTCFRPELESGAIVRDDTITRVNTYRPAQARREKGDPSSWLALLEKQLPDERDRRILLSWMASCVQNKGTKFQWWPVLQGTEGNGKTLFMSAMRHAMGEQFCFAPSVTTIAKTGNQFNSWIENRLFIAIEEIYVAERRNFLEDFKTTVTNEWLPVEGKGSNQVMGDNRANGIMATNHRDGVPITADGRRYCVFYTAQQAKTDLERDGMSGEFFRQFWDYAKGKGQWASQGDGYGFAVFHEYLATYPIDPEFNPAGACQTAPRTSSTHAAITESLGKIEQHVLETIAQDAQGFRGGWVSSIMLDKLLDGMGRAGNLAQHKRRSMMQSLGYDWHPSLTDGRVNNAVLPDGGKARLYVRVDNAELRSIPTAAAVAAAYSSAQLSLA